MIYRFSFGFLARTILRKARSKSSGFSDASTSRAMSTKRLCRSASVSFGFGSVLLGIWENLARSVGSFQWASRRGHPINWIRHQWLHAAKIAAWAIGIRCSQKLGLRLSIRWGGIKKRRVPSSLRSGLSSPPSFVMDGAA